MRTRINADSVLTALSLVVLAILFANIRAPDPRLTVNYDCGLFYGSMGPDAEHDCRTNLLNSRLLAPASGR